MRRERKEGRGSEASFVNELSIGSIRIVHSSDPQHGNVYRRSSASRIWNSAND